MQPTSDRRGAMVVSYLALRKALGILGISLPFIVSLGALILFDTGLLTSVSAYYHTGMGDVFVGILVALGLFLFSYKGYETNDDRFGDFAGLCAIGVALFPTNSSSNPGSIDQWVGIVHLVFSSLFFLTLAYFSLFLFTKTDQAIPFTNRKRTRNRIYRVCGWTILASIALIVAQAVLPSNLKQVVSTYNPVFWLESFAVVAFGISWLIKGEALLRDEA